MISEAVVAVSEDEMVEERDSEQLGRVAQPLRQREIFPARGHIGRRMVMGTEPGGSIHEDQGFEDFAGMHDRKRERTNGHEIDPDYAMLGIQPTDQELLTIQAGKAGPEDGVRFGRVVDGHR